MKTLFAGFFVSLSLLAPVVAHAQKEPAQADIDAAKILFDQAQIAYNAENWSVALESYQKAYSIAKKPTILFNIGQCHRKMNHPKEAADSYKQFIKEDPQTQYLGEVEYKIAELEDQQGNKKEALNYYRLYLQHKLPDDPNESDAKTHIASLEKDIGVASVDPVEPTTKPDGKVTDPPSDGRFKRLLQQPTGKAAIGTAIGALVLGGISIAGIKGHAFCSNEPDCGGFYAFSTIAVAADILGVASISLLFLANKKDKQETPKTTSLQLVPTTTGGFVTFSFTPKP